MRRRASRTALRTPISAVSMTPSHFEIRGVVMKEMQKRIGQGNAANGWHERWLALGADIEGQREHLIVKVMLAVTELAEAVEELRNGHAPTEIYYSEGGKPEGFPVEIADAVIRMLDLAEMIGIELESVIDVKRDYNLSRGRMHGCKTI